MKNFVLIGKGSGKMNNCWLGNSILKVSKMVYMVFEVFIVVIMFRYLFIGMIFVLMFILVYCDSLVMYCMYCIFF